MTETFLDQIAEAETPEDAALTAAFGNAFFAHQRGELTPELMGQFWRTMPR